MIFYVLQQDLTNTKWNMWNTVFYNSDKKIVESELERASKDNSLDNKLHPLRIIEMNEGDTYSRLIWRDYDLK